MDIKISHITPPDSKIKPMPEGFKPSPVMIVRLRGGRLVTMNRRERRQRHIVSKVERQPNPPASTKVNKNIPENIPQQRGDG